MVKVLFTAEGSYPYALGGLTSWAQQLLPRLNAEFLVVAIWGPRRPPRPVGIPPNVKSVITVQLFSPRDPSHMADKETFVCALDKLLSFLENDLDAFAEGLYDLAQLGNNYDLWSSFLESESVDILAAHMQVAIGRRPTIAERLLTLGWLRGALVPLLKLPPPVDLAHTSVNGLGAIPAWLASRLYGVPLLLTEHGVYLRERYLSFSALEIPPAQHYVLGTFYKNLGRLLYRDAAICASVSEFNRYWQIEFGVQPQRTVVIPNGVDPDLFPEAPAELSWPPTAVWVGRVDPLKDLITLVRAFAKVLKTIPEARLRLFGPVPKGNEWYAAEVKREIANLGLQQSVSLEGPVTPVFKAYHSGWVGVISSVSEGFPYTVLENLAVGRPMVGTRVGGIPEVLSGVGRVVPPRNTEALAEALAEFLGNRELCTKLGSAGRQKVLQRYTVDSMVRQYQDVYWQLLGEKLA